jgi:hypothetical protein
MDYMVTFVLIAVVLLNSVVGYKLSLSLDKEVSSARRRLLNETELEDAKYSLPHKKGFLRTDTFDWRTETWVQAQVLPIGICFKEGNKGGSAMLAEVHLNADLVYRRTVIYPTPDCSGRVNQEIGFTQSVVERYAQLETRVSFVFDYPQAIETIPPLTPGVLVS